MSTNYYVQTPDGKEIHLGKSAVGHPFMFRGYLERGVVDYASWLELLALGPIYTEAGTGITVEQMHEHVLQLRSTYGFHQSLRPRPNQIDDANGNRFTLVEFC